MNDTEKQKPQRGSKHEPPLIIYFALLGLYIALSFLAARMVRAEGAIYYKGSALPLSSLAGILSPIANLCAVFLVVLYDKKGFFTALALISLQVPVLVWNLLACRYAASLPELFSNLFTVIAVVLLYRRNKKIDGYRQAEVDVLKKQQRVSRRLFEQTATALVNAIDAKDTYSRGHSLRVAEYSQKIAQTLGKDEDDCRRIYYAALLHDVGKIGIPTSIINKNGRLTAEEYEVIKQHPVKGNAILSSITEYPYLSIGAHYHHERYDGRGYPDRLKGDDIPEIARIISVADAYDAMSSSRSYRAALPQDLVREEIVKGAGTQFDPRIAAAMQHLIDLDSEYKMKEKAMVSELAGRNELHCEAYGSEISDGIVLTPYRTTIRLTETRAEGGRGGALILFDSLDGRVHDDEKTMRDLCYFEYCQIWLDGQTVRKGARRIETRAAGPGGADAPDGVRAYVIEAVKCKDHVLLRIDCGGARTEITVALPDSSRFAYIGLTGERCLLSDVAISKAETPTPEDAIPRIAEKISYIDGPPGDIPNVQVDGYRTDASRGIPLRDGLELRFHTMSLPTARLVWHCPYLVVFSSDDGQVGGGHYREYALIRFDGESWEADGTAENHLTVSRQEDFAGWDAWKERNKQGYDARVTFARSGSTVTASTANLGVVIQNTTTIFDGEENIYVALTGDQCALTAIRARQAGPGASA